MAQNGEDDEVMPDARAPDYYRQLECERIHLLLIDDASKGLLDVTVGKVKDARSALAVIKCRRGTVRR